LNFLQFIGCNVQSNVQLKLTPNRAIAGRIAPRFNGRMPALTRADQPPFGGTSFAIDILIGAWSISIVPERATFGEHE
jgi:hypothetical protein